MPTILVAYLVALGVLRTLLFYLAIVAAVVALLDWAVRTRRVSPFSAIARFCRRTVDPLMAPIERSVLRAGGNPASAPFWALAAVIVGGIILIQILQFVGGLVEQGYVYATRGPFGLLAFLMSLLLGLFQIALAVRVLSSWVQVSPYSRWVYWSYRVTEPVLGPLRQIVPSLGMLDITPIIAYFLVSWVGGWLVAAIASMGTTPGL